MCCRVVSYGRFTAFSCNGTITLYNADRELYWKQEYDFFDGRQVLSQCTQQGWLAGVLGVSTLFGLSVDSLSNFHCHRSAIFWVRY